MTTGTRVQWDKSINDQLWGSGGQSSRSYEVKDRCGGLLEASVSTCLGQVGFQITFKTSSHFTEESTCSVTYQWEIIISMQCRRFPLCTLSALEALFATMRYINWNLQKCWKQANYTTIQLSQPAKLCKNMNVSLTSCRLWSIKNVRVSFCQ